MSLQKYIIIEGVVSRLYREIEKSLCARKTIRQHNVIGQYTFPISLEMLLLYRQSGYMSDTS